jgi:hypothetical protein
MTRREWILIGLTCATAVAGEPWKKKPSAWSNKDVDAILNRSPWAKAALVEFQVGDIAKGPPRGSVVAPPPPNGASSGPGGGGGSRNQMNENPIGGAPVGRGGIPAEASDLPKFQATVRWESAIPIRRARKLEDAASSANQYVISVSGFPLMPKKGEAGDTESDIKQLTRLDRAGKAPLLPVSVDIRKGGMLVLTFEAGEDPITDADREVLFTMGTGSLQTRVRFDLRDMTYQGKLTL